MNETQENIVPILDLKGYILNLMEELGLEENEIDSQNKVFPELLEQAKRRILDAITQNVEDDQMEEALAHCANSNDIEELISEMVRISPGCQIAIIETLENFKKEMVSLKNEV